MILKLVMKHQATELYKVYINHDPWMTLTYFTARSALVSYVFELVGTMKLVRRLVLTKNTPMILKAKLVIKLKVIMSPFISRLLLGQKSVASYWKMGR